MSGLFDLTKDLSKEEKEKLLKIDITEEFNKISIDLDKFHSVFYQIWELGYPRLTFDIPTAAVCFDKKGRKMDFLFNPAFWKESDTYTKEFVICHECLHVILNHGLRIKDIKSNFWSRVANKALDVVINHMLVDKFNFDRYSIQNQEEFCWIDTVFGKDHKSVEKNRSFEYYFGLLKDKVIENATSPKMKIRNKDGTISDMIGELVDSHEFFEDLDNESLKQSIQENINKNLNDLDKKNFVDKLNQTGEGANLLKNKDSSNKAGIVAGNILFQINPNEKVKKKKKWETVINKWSKKFIKQEETIEQWAKQNRRIISMQFDLIIPSEIEDQNNAENKIEVWFFQDISGSCIHLKDRFFRAAKSLPSDRFIIKMFCFDTAVNEVDITKGDLRGGGGTSFEIIENYIQNKIKTDSKKKYPEAVFIITDGYGDEVSPEFPKKWYFFLSTDFTNYLPKESNINKLSNFE